MGLLILHTSLEPDPNFADWRAHRPRDQFGFGGFELTSRFVLDRIVDFMNTKPIIDVCIERAAIRPLCCNPPFGLRRKVKSGRRISGNCRVKSLS